MVLIYFATTTRSNHRTFRRSVDALVIVVGHCGGGGSRGAVSNDEDADGSVIATPLIILRYWVFSFVQTFYCPQYAPDQIFQA